MVSSSLRWREATRGDCRGLPASVFVGTDRLWNFVSALAIDLVRSGGIAHAVGGAVNTSGAKALMVAPALIVPIYQPIIEAGRSREDVAKAVGDGAAASHRIIVVLYPG
jgi:hypothetical protein